MHIHIGVRLIFHLVCRIGQCHRRYHSSNSTSATKEVSRTDSPSPTQRCWRFSAARSWRNSAARVMLACRSKTSHILSTREIRSPSSLYLSVSSKPTKGVGGTNRKSPHEGMRHCSHCSVAHTSPPLATWFIIPTRCPHRKPVVATDWRQEPRLHGQGPQGGRSRRPPRSRWPFLSSPQVFGSGVFQPHPGV